MLETMGSGATGLTKSSPPSGQDPLSWDCHQFPDSATKFSPIKQEIVDTYDMTLTSQTAGDLTELKPLPFDYGSTSLTGVDPVLANNNNNTSSNNNNSMANNSCSSSSGGKVADLNIYIKPLSPPTPSLTCFNQSPSDVTSSGSLSPPTLTKIDFPASQDAFDDIASIVGISMGADSTVPTLENDVDLDAWIENTAQNIKPLMNDNSFEPLLSSSTDTSTSSNSITNPSMTNTQPYLSPLPSTALASLLTQASIKGPRVTSLEQRDPFPQNLSPILRSQLTGYSPTFQALKLEPYEMMKQEYYSNEQLPHSTVPSMPDHRRCGIDGIRSKPKPPKPRPRVLGNGGDQSKKMMHHCQICNRGFLNKSNIKVHLRTHTGEKPFGCEHCSKAFRQKAHLLKHMSIHKRISRD